MERFETIQNTSLDGSTQRDTDPSLLVFILDTNPSAWVSSDGPALQQCLVDVLIFINAHMALNHRNQTAFIASHVQTARFLYPTPDPSEPSQEHDLKRAANGYKPFLSIQDEVVRNLRSLLDETEESAIANMQASMMSGAITLALTYINKQTQLQMTDSQSHLTSRIMILSVSGDLALQHIPMMNSIFSAQKQKVVIDIAKIGGDAVFLQQASDLTKGMYQTIQKGDSLLQTLMMLFLPDQQVRKDLNLPTPANVDFRAACFCHKRVLDSGFVCTVCLSIFCQALPKCLTCDSVFDVQELKAFGARPAVLIKKKKKPAMQHEDSIVID